MNRLGLSEIFHGICENVYFQPPEGYKIKYPCIIYKKTTGETLYADNIPYRFEWMYHVTVIDPDPDSKIPDKVAMLPTCHVEACFTTDNLNHTTFTMYY